MTRMMTVLFVTSMLIVSGCADEQAAAPANGVAANGVAMIDPVQQETPVEKQEEGGIKEKMSGLLKQTKDILNDAGDATGETADDTMKWVNETWKTLKDKGITSTETAGEWVAEDWNAINAWEYKVVAVEGGDPAALEEKLNESGKQRWECFHVSESADGMKFYMKRQKKSYLKHVPLKDMLKLIPLLDGGEQ